MVFIIPWIVFVLASSPILGTLSNEQVDLTQHIYNRALASSIDSTKFLKLIHCESRISFARGDYRSETDTYMAHGPAQWWKSSWDKYSKLYNFKGNYWNSEDQITLAAMVIGGEKNGWRNWLQCGRVSGFGL